MRNVLRGEGPPHASGIHVLAWVLSGAGPPRTRRMAKMPQGGLSEVREARAHVPQAQLVPGSTLRGERPPRTRRAMEMALGAFSEARGPRAPTP